MFRVASLARFMSITLIAALCGLGACNTIEGAGRDVSATGRAVSGAADRATPR
jgi:predicted small secreted protein